MNMKTTICALMTLLICSTFSHAAELKIDADYPGGNILVKKIDGDFVHLAQDMRDSAPWWFYWNFRVRGAAGRTLTFHFTNGNVFGTQGPAVSVDGGLTWSWLGTKSIKRNKFSYKFSPEAKSVRFAFALPYQEADLARFLARHRGNKHLTVHELCKTRKKRTVERIHIADPGIQPKYRILLTCRHHACESTASYVVEGIMDALLANTDDGKWFQENAEVMVIPFMDKDGVEDGDQGKNRKPRDHNRDYSGKSIYPSVRTLRSFVPGWSDGRIRIAQDFHCPGCKGKALFQVGSPPQKIWEEQKRFGKILESVTAGKALPYKQANDIPFGRKWNVPKSYKQGKHFGHWAAELPEVRLAGTLEIPYAQNGKSVITPDTGRAFGADFVRAMRIYLEEISEN